MPELRRSRWNDRGLWSAVVLQAIADIESQPTQSATFAEAVAFFTRSGAWAESRTMIGDFLGLHRDNLEAIGKRCIDARNAREASTREVRSRDVLGMTPLKLARQVARRGDVRPSALHGPDHGQCRLRHSQTGRQTGCFQTSTGLMATIRGCSLVRGRTAAWPASWRASDGDRSSRVHPNARSAATRSHACFRLPRDAILPIEHTMNCPPERLPSFAFSGPMLARSMCAAFGPPGTGETTRGTRTPCPAELPHPDLGRLPP